MLDAGQNIITRNLPKTGQTIVYGVLDDGTYQAGWWRGRRNANNRTRFIERTIAGDDVVLDRATGLMWPNDFTGTGGNGGVPRSWNGPPVFAGAIAWADSLNFAGFADWRMPHVLELASITNFEAGPPYVWAPFTNCRFAPLDLYWTSTTYKSATTQALVLYFGGPSILPRTKTSQSYLIAVRKGV